MSTITKPAQAIETSSNHGSLLERLKAMQSVWILGVLIVIVAVFGIMRPTSSSQRRQPHQHLAERLPSGPSSAVGMTFVIITSGIDLSVGSVLVFSSVVAAKVMEAMGGDGWGTPPSSAWSSPSSPGCSGASSTGSWSPRPRSRH